VADDAPGPPAEKRRRRTTAGEHAVAVAQQAQVAAQAAAHAMAQVAARSAQDYGWPLDAAGGASMPGHPGHLSVGSLLPPSGLFGLDGSRGGAAGGTHPAHDAPPAGQLLYDQSVYATLAALLSRSNNNTGSVHGGSSHNGGGAQQAQQAHAHAQQQAALATAAALAAAGPSGMQLPPAWLDAAAATAARGLGLGSAGGTGGAYHFGPGGVGASLRAAAAAVAAAAGGGAPTQGYPGTQGQQQHALPPAPAQPVSRLLPAPPPRLGVLVAAGALMASRAPLGSALVADAAAAAAASAPPGAGTGGSDGSGGRMSSAREHSAKGTVAALLRAADSEINQLSSPKDGSA
jgi:hypothetical protein